MKKFLSVLFLSGLLVVSSVFAAEESSGSIFRPDPAPVTNFLPEHHLLKLQSSDCPFQRYWADKSINWQNYKKIILVRVNTDHLLTQSWWSQVNSRPLFENAKNDCNTIARYTEDAFIKAICTDKNKRFKLVYKPDPETFYLKIALVELVPSKPFLSAAETGAGFVIPGAGLLAMANKGCVAMEIKLVDSMTGRVLAMATDRERGDPALIDLAGLTWYRHAETSIDNWATEFIKVANSPQGIQGVEDGSRFRLIQW